MLTGDTALYHLARLGWSDSLLLEKSELTAGSTWHAAGHIAFYSDRLIHSRLQKESFDFYAGLERDGRPVGQHVCGSLRLALHADQLREFERFAGRARALGIEHQVVGPAETKGLFPLLETGEILGALYIPDDGYVDPNMTTQAVAGAARALGARIERHTEVTGIERLDGGEWKVLTDRGAVTCEVIVNCAGFWAPQISAMLGFDLPVVAVEDQYLITDRIEAVASLERELPILREMETPFYVRHERDGLMVSCYESAPVFWGLDGIPRDFGRELLPDDLDRATEKLQRTMDFIPALGGAGMKSIVNGPLGRTPDVVGLLGPAHGLRNYWVFCGEMSGFFRSSAARYLAHWIIDGEPGIDLSALDVRRFDARMGKDYAVERLKSAHVYSLPVYYPHAEPAGGRGFKVSPIHDRLQERGAVFGQRNGWEVPNWFAPGQSDAADEPAFEHSNWFAPVAAECRAVHDGAGIIDLTSRAKFHVEGPGSAAWLDWVCASRLPEVGCIAPAPCLSRNGRIAAHFMLARLAEDRFFLTDWGTNEQRDRDWLSGLSSDRAVAVRNVTDSIAVLGISGPAARAVLQKISEASLDGDAFPAMTVTATRLAGVEARLFRLGLTGELDYELHCEHSDQGRLYEALLEAGRSHGLVDFGFRALNALRLEKGWLWSDCDYGMATPARDAGMAPWVDLAKGDFVGRLAYERAGERDDACQPVALIVDTRGDRIAPWGEEPVLCDGREVALTTSGGYGHRIGSAIALASLPRGVLESHAVEVELLGRRYRAQPSVAPPFDPTGACALG